MSALTITRRLAHAGHDQRGATQKARSASWSGGSGRSLLSTATCCRSAYQPGLDEPTGQLYNLDDDPGKERNLYPDRPEIVHELTRTLNALRHR